MYIINLFLSILLYSSLTFAFVSETIQTGRPGQAIGAGVVGTGVFQLQSGYDHQSADTSGTKTSMQTLNNILRLGLTESFEISSIVDHRNETTKVANVEQSQSGISQFQLGFRYRIVAEESTWMPRLALQARFRMKQVSRYYRGNELAPVFLLAAAKNLNESFSVTGNLGLSYSGSSLTPTYSYVLSVSQSFCEKWGAVYELYGNEFAEADSNYGGIGLSYLLSNNFQFDSYVSAGKNRGIEEVYATLGISWRHLLF